jgi:hypothetical protein
MDALIARIKARVADPLRAVDAAAWVCPRPTVAPPATGAEVDAAEAALGFAIPPLLRRLYTEVGNGGFGPNYGLEGVPTIPPVPGTGDIVALYRMYCCDPAPEHLAHVWPHGWVPLIGGGCLYMECADFLRAPDAVVLFDGNDCHPDRPVIESLRPVAVSLEARLEAWLAGERGWVQQSTAEEMKVKPRLRDDGTV